MDKELAKELTTIRAQIHDCIRRLNELSDLRDDETEEELTETQEGVTQVFELTLASEESVTNLEVALAEVYEMILPEEGGEE